MCGKDFPVHQSKDAEIIKKVMKKRTYNYTVSLKRRKMLPFSSFF